MFMVERCALEDFIADTAWFYGRQQRPAALPQPRAGRQVAAALKTALSRALASVPSTTLSADESVFESTQSRQASESPRSMVASPRSVGDDQEQPQCAAAADDDQSCASVSPDRRSDWDSVGSTHRSSRATRRQSEDEWKTRAWHYETPQLYASSRAPGRKAQSQLRTLPEGFNQPGFVEWFERSREAWAHAMLR